MNAARGDIEQSGSDITTLVRAALEPSRDGGLASLLRQITDSLGVSGCILWEVAPGSDLDADPPDGRLFVSASNFPTEPRCAIHNLSLRNSPTGWAVSRQHARIENDLKTAGGDESRCPFLTKSGAMMAIPIILKDENRAALSVYRDAPMTFSSWDLERLHELCDLVPLLYQAVRDRINSRLIGSVDQILEESEAQTRGKLLSLEEKKEIFMRICARVAETLHCREVSLFLYRCREVSLFLNDCSDEAITFDLMATTLPEPLGKAFYRKDKNDGLTGWVLDQGKPALIFDLDGFQDDRDWFQRIYPGLGWGDGISIRQFVGDRLGQPPQDLPNPISVLAVPVSIGDKVIGVIRCALAENPHFFSPRDLELIKLIAAQIAQCWSTWLGRREMKDENEAWLKLVDAINGLNDFVQKVLEDGEPDESRIWEEALKQIDGIIPDADLNSVRLADADAREIRFEAIRGKSWDERQRAAVRDYRTALDGQSAAAQAIQTGEQLLISEFPGENNYRKIFPATKRSIITPIKDRHEIVGVLDIRSESDSPFPKHAKTVAILLGRQLGLYHRLAANIGQLRREGRQQIQTWADISHQLKGPINQAKARADRALDEPGFEGAHLRAVRGLCRKAKRVVSSLSLLSELASQKPIMLNRVFLDQGALVKMLIEASQDTEFLIGNRRNIRFDVNRLSFGIPRLSRVEVDYDLLEQAINNILDNAGKYSFTDTRVIIYGGLTNTRRFHISVRNQGLKIRPNQVKDCVSREWRSDEAIMTTQEGSGIGLWIVDHIMTAHRGELIIVPTTADNMTEVKLVFPLSGADRT